MSHSSTNACNWVQKLSHDLRLRELKDKLEGTRAV